MFPGAAYPGEGYVWIFCVLVVDRVPDILQVYLINPCADPAELITVMSIL